MCHSISLLIYIELSIGSILSSIFSLHKFPILLKITFQTPMGWWEDYNVKITLMVKSVI